MTRDGWELGEAAIDQQGGDEMVSLEHRLSMLRRRHGKAIRIVV